VADLDETTLQQLGANRIQLDLNVWHNKRGIMKYMYYESEWFAGSGAEIAPGVQTV
jgi:hypothetical protein